MSREKLAKKRGEDFSKNVSSFSYFPINSKCNNQKSLGKSSTSHHLLWTSSISPANDTHLTFRIRKRSCAIFGWHDEESLYDGDDIELGLILAKMKCLLGLGLQKNTVYWRNIVQGSFRMIVDVRKVWKRSLMAVRLQRDGNGLRSISQTVWIWWKMRFQVSTEINLNTEFKYRDL